MTRLLPCTLILRPCCCLDTRDGGSVWWCLTELFQARRSATSRANGTTNRPNFVCRIIGFGPGWGVVRSMWTSTGRRALSRWREAKARIHLWRCMASRNVDKMQQRGTPRHHFLVIGIICCFGASNPAPMFAHIADREPRPRE